jgi:hypothetical protein
MASVNSADLAALESLLNEFFAPQTSNVRKREIEAVLAHFGDQTNAWHQCLGFLATTKENHFVSMFVLTTLETIIRRRWIGMAGAERVISLSVIVKVVLPANSYSSTGYIIVTATLLCWCCCCLTKLG